MAPKWVDMAVAWEGEIWSQGYPVRLGGGGIRHPDVRPFWWLFHAVPD